MINKLGHDGTVTCVVWCGVLISPAARVGSWATGNIVMVSGTALAEYPLVERAVLLRRLYTCLEIWALVLCSSKGDIVSRTQPKVRKSAASQSNRHLSGDQYYLMGKARWSMTDDQKLDAIHMRRNRRSRKFWYEMIGGTLSGISV